MSDRLGLIARCEVCERVRDALAGADVGQDEGLPFDVAVLNAAWEEMHREAKQHARAVEITDEMCSAALKAERSERWNSDELRVWAMLAAARGGQ